MKRTGNPPGRPKVVRSAVYRKIRADEAAKRHISDLLKQFGLSPEQYRVLQEAGCTVCGTPRGDRALAMDHDHETGAFRGMLCSPCNTALGLIKDNPWRLQKLAVYVAA